MDNLPEIYHRYLGKCQLVKMDCTSTIIEKGGEQIEVSKNLLAFSPFLSYQVPSLVVIVNGSQVTEVLSKDSFVQVSVLDLDGKSTNEKEKLFQEVIQSHKYSIYENQ